MRMQIQASETDGDCCDRVIHVRLPEVKAAQLRSLSRIAVAFPASVGFSVRIDHWVLLACIRAAIGGSRRPRLSSGRPRERQ